MKRGAPDHPKMLDLATKLAVPKYAAVGVLESLWHWASRYAKRGDVGRFSDEQIAMGIGWLGDAASLTNALVDSRWLDRCACHRLRIHDWPKHAEQSVRNSEDVKSNGFAECYLQEPTSDVGGTYVPPSLPLPLPTPLPTPLPQPGAAPAATPCFEWERKIPIPKGLDVPAFRSALRDWFTYRSERRLCVWKHSTIRQKLSEFEEMGAERSVRAIRWSIGNCWQGIYEPKSSGTGANGQPRAIPRDAGMDEERRAALRKAAVKFNPHAATEESKP